jgi:predicted amidohydrolase
MPPTFKIALIQLAITPLDMKGNFQRSSSYIRSAASQGAKLAVLPEYHLTSWCPEKPGFSLCCLREQWEGYLEKYQALAREEKICIVPGTIVQKREDEEGGGLDNVAYFIDDRGVIVGNYVKKNLWYVDTLHHFNSIISNPFCCEEKFITN